VDWFWSQLAERLEWLLSWNYERNDSVIRAAMAPPIWSRTGPSSRATLDSNGPLHQVASEKSTSAQDKVAAKAKLAVSSTKFCQSIFDEG
jgi:hypothetical protein